MTKKTIDLLKTNKNGFFLQVEGASIDKQAHKNNPCGQFGETMDLDEAVQVALDFAKKDGNYSCYRNSRSCSRNPDCLPRCKGSRLYHRLLSPLMVHL